MNTFNQPTKKCEYYRCFILIITTLISLTLLHILTIYYDSNILKIYYKILLHNPSYTIQEPRGGNVLHIGTSFTSSY